MSTSKRLTGAGLKKGREGCIRRTRVGNMVADEDESLKGGERK